MSWRLAFHSAKLLFSYMIPYKVKIFRDAVFDGKLDVLRQMAAERPRLLHQSIDADGNTALGLALLLGEVDTVKTLLELGSDPNLANAFDGNHALVILAKLRSEENSKTLALAKLLLNAGSDPLREVRYQADSANRIDATQTPSYHETPLLCSVRFQNEELLKQFIEHHVDINYLNPETGISPLMLAAAFGYQNICNLLIDAGAELNANDHTGNTALHFVAQGYGEQAKVAEILIQHGADPQQTNEEGFTPAMLAKRVGNDACFKILDAKKDETIERPNYSGPQGVKDQNIFDLT